MFRDLKEYQEIQRIYESKVCISDEERNLVKCFEEQNFTEEELKYLLDNIDEATSIIAKELSEEIQSLHEETLTEQDLQEVVGKLIKAAANTGLGKKIAASGGSKIAKGVKAIGKSKAFQNVKSGVKDLAGAALRKGKEAVKGALKLGGNVAKAVLPGAAAVGGAIGIGKGVQALRNKGKDKTDAKTDKGTSFGDSIKANTPEPKGTVIQNTIKNTDSKGGDKKTTTSSGGGSSPKPEKKMGAIEKKNRERFGDKRIDFLKQKQKDFKSMDRAKFREKYPNSQSAKNANRKKSPMDMRNESTYDPIKNYHLANDLAKVYQKIYEPAEEKENSTDTENYNALVEFIIKENIVSTVEEADTIIAELDNELVESYLTEGVITEGLMDAVKKVGAAAGSAVKKVGAAAGGAVKKVGAAAGGAVNKAKEVAGNVKTAVGNQIQKRREQVGDLKSGGVDKLKQGNQLRKDTAATRADVAKKTEMSRSGDASAESGMGNDPGRAKAKLMFQKRQREKMNNPNQKQLSGAERAKQMARERLAAKESVEKDAYTVVLEYLLGQKHAATIEEANYIMTELDTETIQGIISES